jgi:Tfp pilus assembly protein PilF
MRKARESKPSVEALDPKDVIQERKLLIAEKDPVFAAYLLRLSVDIGFETKSVFIARDGQEALRILKHEGIRSVLFSDSLPFQVLEAIQKAFTRFDSESVFTFLLTEDSSQAGVGRAVEADVDGFCLRPFSAEGFKTEFLESFREKLLPSEFRKVLNLGKARLFAGDLEQAERLFEKAKSLDAAPASAHFYAGQVKLMRSLLEDSREEFRQGIQSNQVHFRCLKAMFDLLQSQGRTDEAYEVLRRIVGVFPSNVERLKLAIRMAVMTGNFFDIPTWFDVFEGQGERSEEMKKIVCSALSVLGRYLLMAARPSEAVEVFEKALTVGYDREAFLTYAVESLQKYGFSEEASALLEKHVEKQDGESIGDSKHKAA